ncbi:MAG: mechanosensitive channel MscS [Methanomassiliicoccales archaeon PtaU1.Bin124]|nr:MAG: mechanosensitive channel MscS [Methanomassiliicoccales archaeon PtaU1.Bin124]
MGITLDMADVGAEQAFGITIEDWLLFFLMLVATVIIGRVCYVLIRRFFDARLTKRASKNIARVVEYTILGSGAYIGIFFILHLQLTPLLASLGIAGIAVAFASQQIIQNFIAGLIIGVERRIQLEDWIEIVGVTAYKTARVRDITLTKTVLLDPAGHLVYVPNSTIINSQVINYTQAGFFEVPLEVRLDRKADIDTAIHVIMDVAEKEPNILPNPHVEGNRDLERLFEMITMKMKVSNTDLKLFSPRVLITKIDGDDLVVSIRIWIMDPAHKDDIVSRFLRNLNTACLKECVVLNSS